MNHEIPERHTVNCYYCGREADERECVPNVAEYGGNDDGGSICPRCQEDHQQED